MGRPYISGYSNCPYYHKEDACKIYCEGVEEGTSIHLAFESSRQCAEYKRERCRKGYQRCRIYRMMERIYEDGG